MSSAIKHVPCKTPRHTRIHRFAAAAALAMIAQPALADEIFWVGYQNDCMVNIPNNASWFHGDNWLNFLVPGAEDSARLGWGIDGNNPGWPNYIHFGDFCVNVFACPNPLFLPADDAEVTIVTLHDDNWVFDLGPGQTPGGQCANTPTESGTLTIGGALLLGFENLHGNPGSAGLTIRNGPVFVGGRPDWPVATVIFGFSDSASGTLTVEGSQSLLDVDGQILIGFGADSSGTLNIVSGGRVLLSGDQFNQSGIGFVGRTAGTHGSVVVAGTGSLWSSTAQIQVGGHGSGELTISNGGAVVTAKAESPSNSSGVVGAQLGSTGVATVTGAGSRWDQDGSLTVGFWSAGELTIEDGGQVTSAVGHIGRFDGGQGSVLVDGHASLWEISGPLYVGGNEDQPTDAEGELVIRAGGGVTSETAFIGHDGGTGGVALLGADSWLDGGGQVHVGEGGTGLLAFSGGATLLCGSLHVGPTGLVSGEGVVDGGVVNNGTIEPVKQIEITGEYAQSADATLLTEIGPGGANRLVVNGTAAFDGTLAITLEPGYQPSPHDEFVIVLHGGSSGVFQSVQGSGFFPRYSTAAMKVIYCPPDWNKDGVVDTGDLFDFLSDWAAGDADYNGDGVTDSDDLIDFVSEWSTGC